MPFWTGVRAEGRYGSEKSVCSLQLPSILRRSPKWFCLQSESGSLFGTLWTSERCTFQIVCCCFLLQSSQTKMKEDFIPSPSPWFRLFKTDLSYVHSSSPNRQITVRNCSFKRFACSAKSQPTRSVQIGNDLSEQLRRQSGQHFPRWSCPDNHWEQLIEWLYIKANYYRKSLRMEKRAPK